MFDTRIKEQQYVTPVQEQYQPGQDYQQRMGQDTKQVYETDTRKDIKSSQDKVKVVVKAVKSSSDFKEKVKVSIKGSTMMKLTDLCSKDATDEEIVDTLESKIRRLLGTVKEEWQEAQQPQVQEKPKYKVKMMVHPVGGGAPYEQEFITDDPERFLKGQEQHLKGMGLRRKEGRQELGSSMRQSTGATQRYAQM
jgi:hypothetical protein